MRSSSIQRITAKNRHALAVAVERGLRVTAITQMIRGFGRWRGKRTVNVAPRFGAESTSMLPP
jgi:hypothetical protein